MAPGRKQLRKIQMGKESSAGTGVAATLIWRGAGNMLEDQRTVEQIEEQVGIFGGTDRTAVTKLLGGLELAETPLTFEQMNLIPVAGLGGLTTGVADGSGSDFIYTTAIPTTAAPTAAPYTIQAGDDFEAERLVYAVPTKWTVKGEGGDLVKHTSTWVGRTVTTNAFTGSLAIPSVEDALTSKGKVYLDAASGAFGGTVVANQILAFELAFEFQWIFKWTMDGNLYFSLPVYAGHTVKGKLTFEHDTAASGTGGAKADFRDQTARLLRIDLIGSALTTAGTAYSTKKAIFDLPIKYTKVGVLGDKDGNDIVDMEFVSRYNLTTSSAGRIITVNQLTTNF